VIEPTGLDWLALCLCTESNRPEEWPAIAQVVENRRRTGRWGDTYKSVVLARMQFSAFNKYTAPGARYHEETIFNAVVVGVGYVVLLMRAAGYVAENEPGGGLSTMQDWADEVSRETLHYYSPVSMKPPGSKPPWAAQAKRLYTPPGLDPERFVFAEGVP
jgi:hypothetical protein